MKNQYFGDNRDLFTFDLILEVMKGVGSLEQLTFIPMLTPDDRSRDGGKCDRKKAKTGTQNKGLVAHLDASVKSGRRHIEWIEPYFKKQSVKMTVYGGGARYFSRAGRKSYFDGISKELLEKALVFAYPDNGLEVRTPDEKHILFSEVKDLFERMDKGSILMLYQFFPRVNRLEYLDMRCHEIAEKVMGDHPVCVDDNEVAFFFLTKNHPLEEKLMEVVGQYRERYSG